MAHAATGLCTFFPSPSTVLFNAHHFYGLSMIVGARVEGSRPVVTASERYGDELLCSSNYAEQSAIPFPGATSRDTCCEH